MLAFFDFMYYGIYRWYADNSDSGSEAAGFCAVSAFQTFNIISVIWTFNYIFNQGELYLSKSFGLALIVFLFILNYIRYIWIDRFSKEAIKVKWESKSLESQKKIRVQLGLYMAISFFTWIGFIAYSASKKM